MMQGVPSWSLAPGESHRRADEPPRLLRSCENRETPAIAGLAWEGQEVEAARTGDASRPPPCPEDALPPRLAPPPPPPPLLPAPDKRPVDPYSSSHTARRLKRPLGVEAGQLLYSKLLTLSKNSSSPV